MIWRFHGKITTLKMILLAYIKIINEYQLLARHSRIIINDDCGCRRQQRLFLLTSNYTLYFQFYNLFLCILFLLFLLLLLEMSYDNVYINLYYITLHSAVSCLAASRMWIKFILIINYIIRGTKRIFAVGCKTALHVWQTDRLVFKRDKTTGMFTARSFTCLLYTSPSPRD